MSSAWSSQDLECTHSFGGCERVELFPACKQWRSTASTVTIYIICFALRHDISHNMFVPVRYESKSTLKLVTAHRRMSSAIIIKYPAYTAYCKAPQSAVQQYTAVGLPNKFPTFPFFLDTSNDIRVRSFKSQWDLRCWVHMCTWCSLYRYTVRTTRTSIQYLYQCVL